MNKKIPGSRGEESLDRETIIWQIRD